MHELNKIIQPQKLENALYIVATPIGNLNDITIRALNTLASVDYIICEDSRITGILLHNFEIIKKKLIIYNDYSDNSVRNKILNKLQEGCSLALISDAGTPLISDPGYKLLNFLRQEKQKIICVPGASALTASISISGIACDNFIFLGFLPSSKTAKENKLQNLPKNFSFIFFEAPNRIIETLEILKKLFADRKICITRELTKIYEEAIFGSVDEVSEVFNADSKKIRGEFVVIVEKIAKDAESNNFEQIDKTINLLLKNGISTKDIITIIVEIYEINKKEVYSLVLKAQNQTLNHD